uniref:Uncharacterized protein n=1 Tax=Zea mays TaxID=4577 RepID=B6UF88_MAIZE|nr:hypothetical protein [Zea mays]
MALSATNLNTLKALLCAVFILSTTVDIVVARGHCEPTAAVVVPAGAGRRMLGAAASSAAAVSMPRLTRPAAAAAAATYSESKRASPSGPDPQHH